MHAHVLKENFPETSSFKSCSLKIFAKLFIPGVVNNLSHDAISVWQYTECDYEIRLAGANY